MLERKVPAIRGLIDPMPVDPREPGLTAGPLDPMFLRGLSRQARELLPGARTEAAKAQLRTWIAEFEAQAELAEAELAASNSIRH